MTRDTRTLARWLTLLVALATALTLVACGMCSDGKKKRRAKPTSEQAADAESSAQNEEPPKVDTGPPPARELLPGGTRDKLLKANRTPSGTYIDAVKWVEDVAADLRETGSAAKPEESKRWQKFEDVYGPVFMQYFPHRKESAAPFHDYGLAGLSRIDDDDKFIRSVAYKLLEKYMEQTAAKYGGAGDDDFRYALAERYEELPDDDPGKLRPLRLLVLSPSGRLFPYLLRLATGAKDPAARILALSAFDHCNPRDCPIGPADIESWYSREKSPQVQNAMLPLAGRLKLESIYGICAHKLSDSDISQGCREGLSRMKTPQAFDMLYAYLDELTDDPRSMTSLAERVRVGLEQLMPFAQLPPTRERFYALLDKILGQSERQGFTTGAIAIMIVQLPHKDVTLPMVQKHLAAYEDLWPGTADQSQKYVIESFSKAVELIESKGRVPNIQPLEGREDEFPGAR